MKRNETKMRRRHDRMKWNEETRARALDKPSQNEDEVGSDRNRIFNVRQKTNVMRLDNGTLYRVLSIIRRMR